MPTSFEWNVPSDPAPDPTTFQPPATGLDLAAIEAAIAAWLRRGTGLPVARIVKHDQKIPQIAMPYVTYKVPIPTSGGVPDEVRRAYDVNQPVGAEIQYGTRGNREFVVSVQCFTLATVGGADSSGYYTARTYLLGAQAALALPSVSDALNAAGIAMVSVEALNDFTDKLGPVGQGRGHLDVRFRCVEGVSEGTGYINTVSDPTGTFTGP